MPSSRPCKGGYGKEGLAGKGMAREGMAGEVMAGEVMAGEGMAIGSAKYKVNASNSRQNKHGVLQGNFMQHRASITAAVLHYTIACRQMCKLTSTRHPVAPPAWH